MTQPLGDTRQATTTLWLQGGIDYPVHCYGAGDRRWPNATVTNSGPATVFYRDRSPVITQPGNDSIAPGDSAELEGLQFLAVPEGQTATITHTGH